MEHARFATLTHLPRAIGNRPSLCPKNPLPSIDDRRCPQGEAIFNRLRSPGPRWNTLASPPSLTFRGRLEIAPPCARKARSPPSTIVVALKERRFSIACRAQAFDQARLFALEKHIASGAQARIDRVPSNVADAVRAMPGISNEAVEVVLLPKSTGASLASIDLLRGMSLPGLDHAGEILSALQGEEDMDMVRHDHEREREGLLTLEMEEGFLYRNRIPRLLQQTGTEPRVHPLVEPGREPAMECLFGFVIPRLRMLLLPRGPLLEVLAEHVAG